MNKISTLLLSALICFGGFSQITTQTFSAIDVLNYKKQGTISYPEACKTDQRNNYLKQTDFRYFLDYQQDIQMATNPNFVTSRSGGVITIPVVVHVIHLGEDEGMGSNISDAQIYSAINNLNDAYRGTGGYTTDMEIEFCLVSQDPSGNPTTGINRVLGTGVSGYSTDGITDANETAVKALIQWDNTEYYNIWIVSEIDGNNAGGGTQGYAYFYPSAGSKDGAVIMYNSFGYDPNGEHCYNLKSYTNYNVTTIHELGHAFGLYHTFEGDNDGASCPPSSTSGTGDLCADTPSHNRNDGNCTDSGPSCSGDLLENVVDNIMAYSSDYCQVTFTANQKTRAINHINSFRSGLLTSNGCTPVAVPVSKFETCYTSGCEGTTIQFYDVSSGNPNSWNWNFGDGNTSTLQSPSHTYATAGTYTVTLTASNSVGQGSSDTKINYVTILESAASACSITPTHLGYYAYSVSNVTIGDISNYSDIYDNGYSDFSCLYTTTLTPGDSYNLSLTVGTGGTGATQDAYYGVYIDFNNNGVFDLPSELVATGSNLANSGYNVENHNVTMPVNPTLNTLLRMRVINDQFNLSGPCDNVFTGEVEDYGVIFEEAIPAPVAAFSSSNTSICAGENVVFTDASTNSPTSWNWNFGDGATSTSQNPTHTYATSGTFTVTLNATNNGGSDSEVKTNYISVASAPNISSNPSNQSISEGNNTSFSVVASNATTYQWEWYNSVSTSFEALSNTGVYSGVTTSTLNITSGTQSMNGFQYRCVVSGNCSPDATSNSATLNVTATCVEPDQPIVSYPGGTTCAGSTVTLTITGDLNGADHWTVYSGSCGGTLLGTTQLSGYVVAPGSSSTTYFVRGEGGCATATSCGQVQVVVTTNDDASFSYSSGTYCTTDSDPSPTITGTAGGTFSSTAGLSLNSGSGLIDLSASTAGTYSVTYETSGSCPAQSSVDVEVQNCVILPVTKLMNQYCGISVNSFSKILYAEKVYGGPFDYEFEFTPQSGGSAISVFGSGRTITLGQAGILEYGEVYDVRVRVHKNGQVGNYGISCEVSTPVSVPNTSLLEEYCNISVNSFNKILYAQTVVGADQYQFEFTPLSGGNSIEVFGAGKSITLAQAGIIEFGEIYNVRVRAYLNGQVGNYSNICQITTPVNVPATYLIEQFCNVNISSWYTTIYAQTVVGATQYEFKFTPQGGGSAIEILRNGKSVSLSQAGISTSNQVYDVQVRAYIGTEIGTYGNVCQITTPSTVAMTINDDITSTYEKVYIDDFGNTNNNALENVNVYPNPFLDNLTINFGQLVEGVEVSIYNSIGQIVHKEKTSDIQIELQLSELEVGVYLMQLQVGDETKMIRIVKN